MASLPHWECPLPTFVLLPQQSAHSWNWVTKYCIATNAGVSDSCLSASLPQGSCPPLPEQSQLLLGPRSIFCFLEILGSTNQGKPFPSACSSPAWSCCCRFLFFPRLNCHLLSYCFLISSSSIQVQCKLPQDFLPTLCR